MKVLESKQNVIVTIGQNELQNCQDLSSKILTFKQSTGEVRLCRKCAQNYLTILPVLRSHVSGFKHQSVIYEFDVYPSEFEP